MTTAPASVRSDPGDPDAEIPHVRIAIVGSGFAGLGMAIRLKQAGIDDFVVFERDEEVGGTWRDNTYPGAACDVPSHLYSFSFALNPAWSHSFSAQPEIQAYLQDCATRFGVRPHLRFGHGVTDLAWSDAEQRWHITTTQGAYTAQFAISGMGALSEPCIPDLPGIGDFAGRIFHSARWDHDHDLSGERVAVVGTGASSIQFVPQIADRVSHMDVYQRTAPWIIPRVNRTISRREQRLYARFPTLQRMVREAICWARETFVLGFRGPDWANRIPERLARRHLAKQVTDPALREVLTPDYTIGCKRILISNDYYPTLTEPHVDLVPHGVREVRPNGIVAADGVERPADTIIFGTGFHVTDFPAGRFIRGRDGRLLADAWSDRMEGYKGTTVHGFPNLFLLVGPNTGLGHNSMVLMIESQVAYVLDCIRQLETAGVATVEVRKDAQDAYNDRLQERMRDTVWTTGGCASWYLDDQGRNTTLWPDFTFRFRKETERFDVGAYVLDGASNAGRSRHPAPTEHVA